MAALDTPTRRIDQPRDPVGGASVLATGGALASPAIPLPPAPTNLAVINTALARSAVTPFAIANVRWLPRPGVPVGGYVLQWATDSGFTTPTRLDFPADKVDGAVPNLPCGVTVWLRIATIAPAGLVGQFGSAISTLTPSDTTPPAAPGSPAAVFLDSGALRVSWVKPSSPNFRAVEIRIFNSAAKTVEYDLIAEADGTVYDWPAARNRQQTVGSPDGSPDTAVYVELRSLSWGGVYSAAVSASATSARPANVSGVTATWDGATGTCRFKWNVVSGAVGYTLTIDGQPRSVPVNDYEYTLTLNRQEHSGTPDAALSWSIVAVNALDQVSLTATTGTATLARPATPSGVTHSWASDPGTADEDWSIDCDVISGVVKRVLTIDGIARDLPVSGRFTYPFALNGQEHGGVADPSLAWSLVWVDALGQTSTTPASGTATNVAPPATTITAAGFFFTAVLEISSSAALDLRDYRVRVYRNAALVRTFFTVEAKVIYQAEDGDGGYTFDVTVYDRFGQASTSSAQTATQSVRDQAAYIAELREEAIYSDSVGNSGVTLKAALADDVTASGGVAYTAAAGWRWTEVFRERAERYKTATVAMNGSLSLYLGFSTNGTTWLWFYGGTPTAGRWQPSNWTSNEAVAQAGAVTFGAGGGTFRIDLPIVQEARYVRLYHRRTDANITLREWYPATFIRADQIQAGAVEALHIAAGAVVADAIAAGAIDGKLITGATIRTAASGQRVEIDSTGLKTYDSGGVVQVEATTATGGKLRAGAGAITIGADGFLINTPVGGALAAGNSLRFAFDGVEFGKLGAGGSLLGAVFGLLATTGDSAPRSAELYAQNSAGSAQLRVGAGDGIVGTGAALTVTSGATSRVIWRGRISGTTAQLGFFETTPVAKQTLPAAATDDATERTLLNAVRALLIAYGLA
jgi:hypothetical protein